MPLHFEAVGLDGEVVQRDYIANMAFARAYSQEAKSDVRPESKRNLLLLAASSFRRAGASAMLLGQQTDMRNAFFFSADHYMELRMPYSALMDILSKGGRRSYYEETFLKMNGSPTEQVYPLMYAEGYRIMGREFDRAFDDLKNVKRDTVGLFQLPVSDFIELISGTRIGPFQRTKEALRRIVTAYDEGVQSASSRKNEWRLLVQEMHPAEPDIIGPLVMVCTHPKVRDVRDELLNFEMSETTRLLLSSCLETYLDGENTLNVA